MRIYIIRRFTDTTNTHSDIDKLMHTIQEESIISHMLAASSGRLARLAEYIFAQDFLQFFESDR
jgi:hypothetical protein